MNREQLAHVLRKNFGGRDAPTRRVLLRALLEGHRSEALARDLDGSIARIERFAQRAG